MTNENDDFLKRILFGGSLEDKLAEPPSFGFSEQSSAVSPFSAPPLSNMPLDPDLMNSLSALATPGRTGKLLFDPLHANAKSSFPKPGELKNPFQRGKLLHYFANHELLAIETMAFVLLRFPDADPQFRAGVLRTLQDEQRHLGMYLKRMREFGVELGDFPLNLYFWNSLRQMKSPLDFVTQMSLTFEQANLDFALFYANLFQTEIDDAETGRLLKTVHDDEIKHVSHGMKWFSEWRDHSESEFESYLKLLPYPMTARRARGGTFFSAPSRSSAGMSEAFIESVRIAGGSRGKVPHYFFFNPQAELESTMEEMPKPIKQKIDEMAPVMLWLSHEEDVVELPSMPPLSYLSQVYDFRHEIAEIVTETPGKDRYAIFENLKPWGWSKSAWTKLSQLESPVRSPPLFDRTLHSQKLFSKVFWKRELPANHSAPEISDFAEILIKIDQSTSGRGHLRIPRERLNAPEIQSKLAKIKGRGGGCVIEPYYPKLHDFSIQYELDAHGKLTQFEPRFFQVDHLFQYQGAMIGKGISHPYFEASAKFIENNLAKIKSAHEKVFEILISEKYVGPFGIDALTYKNANNEIDVVPIIEVNARFTMGRVAHEVEQVAQKKKQKQGVFRMLSERDLPDYGVRSFAELEKNLRSEFVENFVPITPSSAKETWVFVVLSADAVDRFLIPTP